MTTWHQDHPPAISEVSLGDIWIRDDRRFVFNDRMLGWYPTSGVCLTVSAVPPVGVSALFGDLWYDTFGGALNVRASNKMWVVDREPQAIGDPIHPRIPGDFGHAYGPGAGHFVLGYANMYTKYANSRAIYRDRQDYVLFSIDMYDAILPFTQSEMNEIFGYAA